MTSGSSEGSGSSETLTYSSMNEEKMVDEHISRESPKKLKSPKASTTVKVVGHYLKKKLLSTRLEKERSPSKDRQTTTGSVEEAMQFVPDVSFTSAFLSPEAASVLMAALPTRLHFKSPQLVFRLSTDGTSFCSFWARVSAADQSIIIIRTTSGEVFGAFCSSSWSERKDTDERLKANFFGTGESFVWTLPSSADIPVVYPWSALLDDPPVSCPQLFQAAGDSWLVVGGDALGIYDELSSGVTSPSATFASPSLVHNGVFDIDDLEVFAVPSG